MLIRVVKKGNRDMCAVSGLPANTEEWKRFDRIFEENVLELGFDEQKNEIYLVYMMTCDREHSGTGACCNDRRL